MPSPKRPRKELRLLVDIPIEVRGPGHRFAASGRDLTFSGVRIRYRDHLVVGEHVEIALKLPSGLFEVPAEVCWTEPEAPDECAGLQFLHTKASRGRLYDLIVALETGSPLRRRTPTVKWKPMK